jgi:hypothetical protein
MFYHRMENVVECRPMSSCRLARLPPITATIGYVSFIRYHEPALPINGSFATQPDRRVDIGTADPWPPIPGLGITHFAIAARANCRELPLQDYVL